MLTKEVLWYILSKEAPTGYRLKDENIHTMQTVNTRADVTILKTREDFKMKNNGKDKERHFILIRLWYNNLKYLGIQ